MRAFIKYSVEQLSKCDKEALVSRIDDSCTSLGRWIEYATTITARLTYTTSAALITTSNVMSYLNKNAAAFGVLFGAVTCIANVYFNWRRSRKPLAPAEKKD